MKKSRRHHMRKAYERRVKRRLEQATAVRERLGLTPKKPEFSGRSMNGFDEALNDGIMLSFSANLYAASPRTSFILSGLNGV